MTTTTLTDVEAGIWLDRFETDATTSGKLQDSSDWSITKRTLRGGMSDGIDVVELNNGVLSMSVLPTRGMGLWKGQFGDTPIGWTSPVKLPVHPKFVNLTLRDGLGWLAGFNELLCRCGLASNGPPGNDNGESITLHGRIANLPAHQVEVGIDVDGDGALSVTGEVDEAMLFGGCLRLRSTVSTTPGSNSIQITDTVTNLAGQPAEIELLYHTNLGRPFLGEGSRFVAAFDEVVPKDSYAAADIDNWQTYAEPVVGYAEQVYFVKPVATESNQTRALLRNAAGDLGVSIAFDPRELPCFTVWKNTQAEADGYVTGLEPSTSLPNFRSFEREQGRVISLEPGSKYTTSLELAFHSTADEVNAVETSIISCQPDRAVTHLTPRPEWSPSE